tara:strand:- start:855 stop:1091 length:237 start_codon:yes stop_codon:yes gene_type:complete
MAFIGPELHTLGGLGSFMDASKSAGGGSTDGGSTVSTVVRASQQGGTTHTAGSYSGTWLVLCHSIENNGRHGLCVRTA